MRTTTIPRVLRSFHLPTSSRGTFAEGNLAISGLGKFLFPASPCRTVVRTLPDKSTPSSTGVNWLRSFGGKDFMVSEHRHSGENGTDGIHEVEYLVPLSFTFDWSQVGQQQQQQQHQEEEEEQIQQSLQPQPQQQQHTKAGRPVVVSPQHKSTSLLGILPLPLWLVGVSQQMTTHSDDQGWDLDVIVTALAGHVHLITYKGSMRLLQQDSVGQGEQSGSGGGRFVDGFHDLVLFDGQCNLCNASVDFLIQRDVDERLIFCAQQSPEGVAALERYRERNVVQKKDVKGSNLMSSIGGPSSNDSVLVLGSDGKLREKSDAALRAGEALGGGWRVLAGVARVVPVGVRDLIYDWIGRHRYQWFGKKDTCRMPTPQERRRFL